MDSLHLNMLINKKKETCKNKEIIKSILNILEQNKVNIDITNINFDTILDEFLRNYVYLLKIIEVKKDDVENRKIVSDLLEEMIDKIQRNDFIIPELNKKKIIIQEKCIKHYKNNSNNSNNSNNINNIIMK